MSEKPSKPKNGGKKGGTQFPKYSLAHLIPYLNSLASKTHTTTINLEQLSAGVFGIKTGSSTGKIKSSALKQFGLLEGDYTNFKATELASEIALATNEERKLLLQQSFDKVKAFINSFDTFQNSKTDKGKIGQYAVSTLKIHPDFKDDFVKILLESADVAGLCKVDGNTVLFEKKNSNQENRIEDSSGIERQSENEDESSSQDPDKKLGTSMKHGASSNINVTIDVNSSMDPDKLERLLKLLKGYGAI